MWSQNPGNKSERRSGVLRHTALTLRLQTPPERETLRPIRTQGHGKVSFSEEEVQMERNEMWKSLFLIPPTR